MRLNDIIQTAIDSGKVCDHYLSSLREASNLKGVMDILMDVNGLDWLSSHSVIDGIDFRNELHDLCPKFINGRYIAEYKNKSGNGYTSSLFVGPRKHGEWKDEDDHMQIEAKSTILCLLRVHGQVFVPKNAFVQIFVDNDSDVMVRLDKDAKCVVNVKGKGLVLFDATSPNTIENMIIEHHKE